MDGENLPRMTFSSAREGELVETRNNVVRMNLVDSLANSARNDCPVSERHRSGWKDGNRNFNTVDCPEWQAIADLGGKTPDWTHTMRELPQIGNFVSVTVAITVNGITREGIGTGSANCEMGIKKAGKEAFRAAAANFGTARGDWRRKWATVQVTADGCQNNNCGCQANPLATSLMDLVTAKQLGMIRAVSREMGINADKECRTVFFCTTNELSRNAAAAFIRHLQELDHQAARIPLTKVA